MSATATGDGARELPTLQQEADVFVIDLGADENRFHPDWIAALDAALEVVENASGPRALVTIGSGRIWSNGLDLDWVDAHPGSRDRYFVAVHGLLARFLALPVVTVAAVQGHAFGAGAMLALAHDVRLMRADRGYWCLPEMDLGIPFTRAMAALVQRRLAPPIAQEAMLLARRYGGEEAARLGIVDGTAPLDALRGAAIETARAHRQKAGEAIGVSKARMHADVLTLLRDPVDPLA